MQNFRFIKEEIGSEEDDLRAEQENILESHKKSVPDEECDSIMYI